jgi:hypothetical protein
VAVAQIAQTSPTSSDEAGVHIMNSAGRAGSDIIKMFQISQTENILEYFILETIAYGSLKRATQVLN